MYRFNSGRFEFETLPEFRKVFLPLTPGLPGYDYRKNYTYKLFSTYVSPRSWPTSVCVKYRCLINSTKPLYSRCNTFSLKADFQVVYLCFKPILNRIHSREYTYKCKQEFYVVRTLHFGMKLYYYQRNAQVVNLFINLLLSYMFRAFF
jgi:hypothetical protein